jgi:hypothetical protein
MQQLKIKITITVGLILCGLTTMSQKTSRFTFGKKDSAAIFRGFGVGFEYYSGHEKMSKLVKFKRDPHRRI